MANAISPILSGGASAVACNGNALIRSITAMPVASGGEIIYLGMYGSATNGSLLPGHVLSAVYNPASGSAPTWNDLTLNPVINSAHALNYYGLDISSITVDAHDTTGNTVYVTVEGMPNQAEEIETVYRTTNGGSTWTNISSNLPYAPASSLAIDPQNANTVYVATDAGVYFTPEVANCGASSSDCWSAFGTGLPAAPAVALSAAPASASTHVLVAATYGRGIWQTPLWTAGTALSAASVTPASLTFGNQSFNSTSSPHHHYASQHRQHRAARPPPFPSPATSVKPTTASNQSIAPGSSCTIQVTFTPQATGPLTGQMTIYANVYGGQLTRRSQRHGNRRLARSRSRPRPSRASANRGGNGLHGADRSPSPTAAAAVPIGNLSVSSPFVLLNGNACGTISLAASSDCPIQVRVRAHYHGSLYRPAHADRWSGNANRAAHRNRSRSAHRHCQSPCAHVSPHPPIYPRGASSPRRLRHDHQHRRHAAHAASPSPSAARFKQTPNCNTQLAAGAVCTIGVVFAPTQLGALSGTLTIYDALNTQTVSLGGTGVAPPVFNVTPTSLTFTNQQPGVASAPQTVTIANAGASPMANIGFAITGSAALPTIPAFQPPAGRF